MDAVVFGIWLAVALARPLKPSPVFVAGDEDQFRRQRPLSWRSVSGGVDSGRYPNYR